MRVLYVLNTGKYSGAENVVITLIHALDGLAECAYASPDGPIRNILENENILHFPVSTTAINAKELKDIIREFRPDIIHTNDYNAGIMTCLTGTRVPIINHLHNNTPWLKTLCLKSIAYFLSCWKYQRILTVSNSVMDEFIFGRLLKKKSIIVGNPIDTEKIREKSNKAELKEASDIVFLGRLSPQKNPFFFLDIIQELVETMPEIKVAMVGTGELRNQVENKILEYGLEKNIKLYGFQRNPYGLLKASKIMCMPSVWEGFGLAAVEGLTLGKPVICSGAGGLKEIITSKCGAICGSKEEYVKEIKKLLLNNDIYNQYSKNAFQRSLELDNLASYTETISNVYHEVMDNVN